jgi:diacylglycerol O-acyltransferase
MSRPLWEAYIIEGLDNIPDLPKGSFAVYTKMHHSLVDGGGGANFMAAIHDTRARASPRRTNRATHRHASATCSPPTCA